MTPSMFCPACGGRVVACVSVVHDGRRNPIPTFAAVCLCCPLVSEISTTGYLEDLGAGIQLEDLEAPSEPGDLAIITIGVAPTPLRHGRDS